MLPFALCAQRDLHELLWEDFARSEAFIIIPIRSLIFVRYSPDLEVGACVCGGEAGFQPLYLGAAVPRRRQEQHPHLFQKARCKTKKHTWFFVEFC